MRYRFRRWHAQSVAPSHKSSHVNERYRWRVNNRLRFRQAAIGFGCQEADCDAVIAFARDFRVIPPQDCRSWNELSSGICAALVPVYSARDETIVERPLRP